MHTDKAIAEFEAWAGSEAFGLSPAHFAKDEAGDYINYPTQCYWLVWRASRRELVIELPRPDTNMHNGRSDAACELLLEQWDADRAAIEAAGVTVRG